MSHTTRRDFLKYTGLSLPAISYLPAFKWEKAASLEDYRNQDGDFRLRLEIQTSTQVEARFSGKIDVKGVKSFSTRSWFFESSEDYYNPEKNTWEGKTSIGNTDVLVIQVHEATAETVILIKEGKSKISFSLQEVVAKETVSFPFGKAEIQANLLMDREIGEISLGDFGAGLDTDEFSFVIMADPQGGDPAEPSVRVPTRMKIHNAFIEESVRVVNEMTPSPAFVVVNGDIVDSEGQASNFSQMLNYLKKIKVPVLFEVGNHETRYRSEFSPGYNMSAFDNFFAAQKEMNGLDKMLYSFNAGKWHIVVFPDPLRTNFWETHPHYFEWLENDLEKYRTRPTIFIQHVPIHPIGIDPLINYVESPQVKRILLDILARHGNVRYVFSGHVHIPLKASIKTAVTWKGIQFINLPAAGYRPRNFGEPDIDGGPTQGVAVVNIKGDLASVSFKTVMDKEYPYPDRFPDFDPDAYPLWLNMTWELPVNELLMNGSFEQGLAHWHRRFVYQEDENPANICEVRRVLENQHAHALYLYCCERGYPAPGQDRMPQTLNRVCQVVAHQPGKTPVLKFAFRPDLETFSYQNEAGCFIWIEGLHGSHKYINLVYSLGQIIPDPGGKYSFNQQRWYQHFGLEGEDWAENALPDWQEVSLNLAFDYNRNPDEGKKFQDIEIDRWVIHLGVWTCNDGEGYSSGIYIDDLGLTFLEDGNASESRVGERKVETKDDRLIWNKVNRHIAGEHRYIERK